MIDVSQTTRIITVNLSSRDDAAIAEAVAVLRSGGLVAFPTETVYGLGADATNPAAVARIFEAKERPATNPLIVHGHDVHAVRKAVSEWPDVAEKLADAFWPGPLTIVLPRSAIIPNIVTAGKATVGVRVPRSRVALDLLQDADLLLAAPSANRSNRVSPTLAKHVLKDLDGRIALILDSGPTGIGIESTVLDLTTDPPRILRPGSVTQADIEDELGIKVASPLSRVNESTQAASSPGQMEVHYSPNTPVEILDFDNGVKPLWPHNKAIGVIVLGQALAKGFGRSIRRVEWRSSRVAERELYATLHDWDDGLLDLIYVVMPPDEDEWQGVRDRLRRASRRWTR